MSRGVQDTEKAQLLRDKYDNDASIDLSEDLARLVAGEPLAYVIGWVPFLGLRIDLDSRPLIPRPETEWWTEELITHLTERFADKPFTFLDLCAGSGAIGLAILARFPAARVSFGELIPEHASLIRKNLHANGLNEARADIRTSDLFEAFADTQFDIIATNPPYIPEDRSLDKSVTEYEPSEALYSGTDGLTIIRTIADEAAGHLTSQGELWMECDIANIDTAALLLIEHGASYTTIRSDQYGRPRIVVGYYA